MTAVAMRLIRVPLVVAVVAAVLAGLAPLAMSMYQPYIALRGIGSGCVAFARSPFVAVAPPTVCASVAELYRRPFLDLMADAALRSLVLLVGAAVLALAVGGLLGIAIALLRRRAFASGAVIGGVSLLAAVPSFFVAYFLQIAVIVVGANATGGNLLPVFGFGYDSHIVLPLLSISVPAIAYTAQLTATRMNDVLDSHFVTTANAKGLRQSWIVRVHVLPHVTPTILEGLSGGLRISVASLPIVETLFSWNGIGALGLQAVALKDAPAFVFCAVVLASLFAILGAAADLSRPRAVYGEA